MTSPAEQLEAPARRKKPVRRRPRALKACIGSAHPLAHGAELVHPSLPEWLPPWCLEANLAFAARLSMPTPSNNELRHMHFATYQKVRHRMRMELKRYLPTLGEDVPPSQPLPRAALLIVRVGDKLMDWDNVYGGIKPLQDCLVPYDVKRAPSGLGLVMDDNPLVLPHPPYILQRLAGPESEGHTDLFVFALPAELAPAIAGDQLALPAGACAARTALAA